jgi:hypothetical protein
MILPYSKRTQQKEELKMAKIPRPPSGGAFRNSIPKKNQNFSRQKRKISHISSVEINLQISKERRI